MALLKVYLDFWDAKRLTGTCLNKCFAEIIGTPQQIPARLNTSFAGIYNAAFPFQTNNIMENRRKELEIMATYAYVRVSSTDQNEDRQLIAMQGMNIPQAQIFIDKQSGKDFAHVR